ncbi:MAG TPA: phosphoribosylamine--glycine ligase [Spirochaetota bacterium]|nr:phosphoribosylamine--glycine ligase [Spirochaetota bacterium]HPR47184.1 phosphoribosylamine--glycine ligase [Spirochaetota bacterium]
MKYLVIGSGGREHALAWRLLADGSAREVYAAPGNGGIDEPFRVSIAVDDFKGIEAFCAEKKIDMVVVGPEAPLVEGLADFLETKKIPVFGPSARAAMLEGSKLFAKTIMEKYGVPTGAHADFTSKEKLVDYVSGLKQYPIVIKLDGLAAGKGVALPENLEQARAFIDENVSDGARVFVEEYFDGEEASVLGISDGETVLPFVAAQDHKRAFDGDKGPNTGGMGAYAPAPVMTGALLEKVRETVLQPTIDGMRAEGIPFKGILYAGLIISGGSINVLEYNVRFGDPEAQVILPLLEGKLGDYIQASVAGRLGGMKLSFKKEHAITVVMASGGYPGSYPKGKVITGLDRAGDDIIVFHAGTRREGDNVLTSGGRVLNVTALGATLEEARQKVYDSISSISFEGGFYRKDIAYRALGR